MREGEKRMRKAILRAISYYPFLEEEPPCNFSPMQHIMANLRLETGIFDQVSMTINCHEAHGRSFVPTRVVLCRVW